VSAQYVPEPTPPTKWMSEVNKMVKCKHPGCAVKVTPPQSMCSWMCEVDFNKLHAQEPFKIQMRREHGYSCTCGCATACRCSECDKLYGKKRGRQ